MTGQRPVDSLRLVQRHTAGRPVTTATPRRILARLDDQTEPERSLRNSCLLGLELARLEHEGRVR